MILILIADTYIGGIFVQFLNFEFCKDESHFKKLIFFYWFIVLLCRTICCVFQPAFRCCVHSKAGRNTFQAFLFSWFKAWNHWKSFKMNQKRLKMAQKSVSNSFLVRAAPESWSKYTTTILLDKKTISGR